jgi:hypothetical protein
MHIFIARRLRANLDSIFHGTTPVILGADGLAPTTVNAKKLESSPEKMKISPVKMFCLKI